MVLLKALEIIIMIIIRFTESGNCLIIIIIVMKPTNGSRTSRAVLLSAVYKSSCDIRPSVKKHDE